MATFPVPSCKECACPDYVNNCSQADYVSRAKGQKLYFGERYCLNGKRALRFKASDSWQRVPSWCPRKRRYPLVRIYRRSSRRDSIYLIMGIKKTIVLPTPEDYVFCRQTNIYHTPRQLYLALRSGNEDLHHLLGQYPSQYDVVEADIGVRSYFLFWGDKDWVKLYDFDKSRCDTGMIGELFVQPHQGGNLQRYAVDTADYAKCCLGYLEGYFAENRFRSHWIENQTGEKKTNVQGELDTVLLVLQTNGFLKSFKDFWQYCYDHAWAMLGRWSDDEKAFGFFVEMPQNSFYLRCSPDEDNIYHIRIYCYSKA